MIDGAQIVHRTYPAVLLAGAVLIVVCASAFAKGKPVTDRVEMFGAPKSGVIAKAKELPNVDDPDVVVLSRTYIGIPADEVNMIDEQCEECVPALAKLKARADLARMSIAILICAFMAGIINFVFPFSDILRKPRG